MGATGATHVEQQRGQAVATSAAARWLASFATFGVPQAAGPIAFALVAIGATGSAEDGALLVLAMTLAQILGAVPVSRWGTRWNAVSYLRLLVTARTAGLLCVAVLATLEVDFWWLTVAAMVAGLVNGAAYGYLRATLNYLAPVERMPRMIGVATTLNELTFVITPILTSMIGSASVVAAVVLPALLGAAPAVLMPRVPRAALPAEPKSRTAPSGRAVLWLACAVATSSAIAGVEVGAVSIAIRFGMSPSWGAVFAAALCVAAVAGGIVVSVRNRRLGVSTPAAALLVTAVGAALVALNIEVWVTLMGAVMMGAVLAPFSTHISLTLDEITPEHQRVEIFALYRTSNAVGVIIASCMTAFVSTSAALGCSAAATGVMALAVVAAPSRGRPRRTGDRARR